MESVDVFVLNRDGTKQILPIQVSYLENGMRLISIPKLVGVPEPWNRPISDSAPTIEKHDYKITILKRRGTQECHYLLTEI